MARKMKKVLVLLRECNAECAIITNVKQPTNSIVWKSKIKDWYVWLINYRGKAPEVK